MEAKNGAKLRILCLHGFRTSGSYLKKRIIEEWEPRILAHFNMDFPDGPYPAGGKVDIEGKFPPPYLEWFQFNEDFSEYRNLEGSIDYLCEYIKRKGPFDGLLGFSQGASLSGLLLGCQEQGKILKEHPPMKLFVSITGAKIKQPGIWEDAYKDPIKVKSVHIIGHKDWSKLPSEELATAFENPLIIHHPHGHIMPRLDEDSVEKLDKWIMEIVRQQSRNAASVETREVKLENGEEPEAEAKSE